MIGLEPIFIERLEYHNISGLVDHVVYCRDIYDLIYLDVLVFSEHLLVVINKLFKPIVAQINHPLTIHYLPLSIHYPHNHLVHLWWLVVQCAHHRFGEFVGRATNIHIAMGLVGVHILEHLDWREDCFPIRFGDLLDNLDNP